MASTLRFDNWENSNGDLIASFENPAVYRGKNLLYNGAMQVAQRGTSSTGITTGGYYTADRWLVDMTGLGTWTQTVEADGPTGSGFTKSLKMECTTADAAPASSDQLSISQRLEGQDLQGLKKGTADAEAVTLSFWVKSNVTGTYIAWVYDSDNNRCISASYTVDSSGTWEKKTITYVGDTTGVFNNDNGASIYLRFYLGAGSALTSGTLQTSWGTLVAADVAPGQTNLAASTSNYWQVTGVQLEAGTVANEFDHKSYGVELAECRRYYQEHEMTTALFYSPNVNTTRFIQFILNPIMRSIPTVTVLSNGEFSSVNNLNRLSNKNSIVHIEGTVNSAGNYGYIGRIAMSAEL